MKQSFASVFKRRVPLNIAGRLQEIQLPLVPAILGAAFLILGIAGEAIAPYSAYRAELLERLQPPAWMERGTARHLFGTDPLGRDVLSRVIVGTRISLGIAVVTVTLATLIGTFVGVMAGFYEGWVDVVLMRFADVMFALPFILIALLAVVVLGPSTMNIIIVLAVVLWARFARLVRSDVLSIKNREYVEFARALGCSNSRVVFVHILPNIVNTVVVFATLHISWVIIAEATLSFLGAGVPPPAPAWGSLVSEGQQFIFTHWWLSAFPGIVIALTVLSFNLLGDWARERLDPRRSRAP